MNPGIETTGYYTFLTSDHRSLRYFATNETAARSLCSQDWHHRNKEYKLIRFEKVHVNA